MADRIPTATMIANLTELVTSSRWRWEDNPGSLTLTGLRVDGASPEGRAVRWTTEWSETAGRVVRVEHYSRPPDGGPDLPDVTDAATCGCLLATMYAAEAQHVTPSPVSVCLSQFGLTDSHTVDAIIAAILAAPPPEVPDVG